MSNFLDFGVEYQTKILNSKAKVIFLKRKGFPIQIQVCIKSGTKYNTMPGIAHFLEHMLVSGTKTYPSKLALVNALEEIGGHLEAKTDVDFLRITLSVPQTKYVQFAISIIDEILTSTLFEEEIFKNEQSVILREQIDVMRDDSKSIMHNLMNRIYSDFDLHYNNLGTSESVSKISLEKIKDFYNKNICAERISFIVSGDVEVNEVEEKLSSIKLKKEINNDFFTLAPYLDGEKIILKKQTGDSVDILVGFRCDTDDFKEVAALFLIQHLFMGRSSLFMQELRYKRGLVYGGGVPFWNFSHSSVFGIRTTCATKNLNEVIDVIFDILFNLSLSGISESEYEKLKVKFDSYCRFNLQSTEQWIEAESFALRHNRKDKNINALTLLSFVNDDVNHVFLNEIFKKYLNKKNAHCVLAGDVSDENLIHYNQLLR